MYSECYECEHRPYEVCVSCYQLILKHIFPEEYWDEEKVEKYMEKHLKRW